MNVQQILKEWERGCSCSIGDKPSTCKECTDGAIRAIKVQVLNEFTAELKAASNSFLHPHIDGVTGVCLQRIALSQPINGTEKE